MAILDKNNLKDKKNEKQYDQKVKNILKLSNPLVKEFYNNRHKINKIEVDEFNSFLVKKLKINTFIFGILFTFLYLILCILSFSKFKSEFYSISYLIVSISNILLYILEKKLKRYKFFNNKSIKILYFSLFFIFAFLCYNLFYHLYEDTLNFESLNISFIFLNTSVDIIFLLITYSVFYLLIIDIFPVLLIVTAINILIIFFLKKSFPLGKNPTILIKNNKSGIFSGNSTYFNSSDYYNNTNLNLSNSMNHVNKYNSYELEELKLYDRIFCAGINICMIFILWLLNRKRNENCLSDFKFNEFVLFNFIQQKNFYPCFGIKKIMFKNLEIIKNDVDPTNEIEIFPKNINLDRNSFLNIIGKKKQKLENISLNPNYAENYSLTNVRLNDDKNLNIDQNKNKDRYPGELLSDFNNISTLNKFGKFDNVIKSLKLSESIDEILNNQNNNLMKNMENLEFLKNFTLLKEENFPLNVSNNMEDNNKNINLSKRGIETYNFNKNTLFYNNINENLLDKKDDNKNKNHKTANPNDKEYNEFKIMINKVKSHKIKSNENNLFNHILNILLKFNYSKNTEKRNTYNLGNLNLPNLINSNVMKNSHNLNVADLLKNSNISQNMVYIKDSKFKELDMNSILQNKSDYTFLGCYYKFKKFDEEEKIDQKITLLKVFYQKILEKKNLYIEFYLQEILVNENILTELKDLKNFQFNVIDSSKLCDSNEKNKDTHIRRINYFNNISSNQDEIYLKKIDELVKKLENIKFKKKILKKNLEISKKFIFETEYQTQMVLEGNNSFDQRKFLENNRKNIKIINDLFNIEAMLLDNHEYIFNILKNNKCIENNYFNLGKLIQFSQNFLNLISINNADIKYFLKIPSHSKLHSCNYNNLPFPIIQKSQMENLLNIFISLDMSIYKQLLFYIITDVFSTIEAINQEISNNNNIVKLNIEENEEVNPNSKMFVNKYQESRKSVDNLNKEEKRFLPTLNFNSFFNETECVVVLEIEVNLCNCKQKVDSNSSYKNLFYDNGSNTINSRFTRKLYKKRKIIRVNTSSIKTPKILKIEKIKTFEWNENKIKMSSINPFSNFKNQKFPKNNENLQQLKNLITINSNQNIENGNMELKNDLVVNELQILYSIKEKMELVLLKKLAELIKCELFLTIDEKTNKMKFNLKSNRFFKKSDINELDITSESADKTELISCNHNNHSEVKRFQFFRSDNKSINENEEYDKKEMDKRKSSFNIRETRESYFKKGTNDNLLNGNNVVNNIFGNEKEKDLTKIIESGNVRENSYFDEAFFDEFAMNQKKSETKIINDSDIIFNIEQSSQIIIHPVQYFDVKTRNFTSSSSNSNYNLINNIEILKVNNKNENSSKIN